MCVGLQGVRENEHNGLLRSFYGDFIPDYFMTISGLVKIEYYSLRQ
jgi:hypothetical protein